MPWPCASDAELTVDRLRYLVTYQPETGNFIRNVSTAPRAMAGTLAGDMDSKGYWRVRVDRKRYLAHRLAWFYVHGEWPAVEVDHRNGVTADNRLTNLRLATVEQNRRNTRTHKDNSAGFKGVSWSQNMKKWRSRIRVENAEMTLGYFDTRAEAHSAYEHAATAHFGEFARVT